MVLDRSTHVASDATAAAGWVSLGFEVIGMKHGCILRSWVVLSCLSRDFQ